MGGAIDGPVLTEFFRAEDEDVLVAVEEVFDDGESGVGFAEPDAVGKDTAVEIFNFVDSAFDAVFLKREEFFPNG